MSAETLGAAILLGLVAIGIVNAACNSNDND
jgi:hypothetical protein